MPGNPVTGSRSTLILSLLAQSVAMLPVFLTGSMYPLIAADIALPPDRLGMVIATFFSFSAIASACLAPLADRLGPWMVIRSCLLALFLGLAVLICSQAEIWLFAGMCIAGAANGCIQPATNVAISRYVLKSRQGIAFGLKQSAVPFATMLAGFAVPALGMTLGWRAAYAAALMLVAALVFTMPRSTTPRETVARVSRGTTQWGFILLVSALAGLGAGSANAMAAFIVGYGVYLGIAPATAGLVVALGSALSIGIRLVLGVAADRYPVPIFVIVAIMLLGGAFGYTILAIYPTPMLFALGAILSFGMGWGWAGISLLGVVRASGNNAGQVTGIMQAGLFLGAVIGPLGFGWLVRAHSYAAAWTILAVTVLIAATLGFSLHFRLRGAIREGS